MKTIAISFLLGMLAVGGTAYYFGLLTNETTYSNTQEEKVIECGIDCIDDEDVKAAALAEQRRKAAVAELESLQLELTAENERHDAKSDELDAAITELEKELGSY